MPEFWGWTYTGGDFASLWQDSGGALPLPDIEWSAIFEQTTVESANVTGLDDSGQANILS